MHFERRFVELQLLRHYTMLILCTEFLQWLIHSTNVTLDILQPLGAVANCEKRLLASSWWSVCLSIRMEQLGSHFTDFDEI